MLALTFLLSIVSVSQAQIISYGLEGSCTTGPCGGYTGTCYCDTICHDAGDCCDDACNVCPDTFTNTTNCSTSSAAAAAAPSAPPPTGAICFTGNSLVTLEDGTTKPFREVEAGDVILGADRSGKMSYSPVIFTPHPTNNVTKKFDEIVTIEGKTLRMTRNHLLPTCDGALVTARSLKVGDCVMTKDGEEIITKTTENIEANGIYTAVTKNEFLVVDGIVASPFALAHGIAHSLFDREDVSDWCEKNSHLVPATNDNEIKSIVARRRLLSEVSANRTTSCTELMETLFENYKDQGVGWGTEGWGYRHFETQGSQSRPELRQNANLQKSSLLKRLSGFVN
jgi:hypothetical protein